MSAFSTCPRKIAIVGYGGAQSLDINGPFEVFAMANRFGALVAYEPILASPNGGAIVCNSGLSIAGSSCSLDHGVRRSFAAKLLTGILSITLLHCGLD